MANPSQGIRVQCFTTKYNGIARELKTEALVFPAFDPAKVKAEPLGKKYTAIWDTGATNTVITQKVADDLGLKPIGMTKVNTASQTVDAFVYIINIRLPSKVGLALIKVTQSDNLGDGTDLLIGMDIISMGDFAVTNRGGKTTFSFRFPSVEMIDFVETKKPITSKYPVQVRPNDPCPCGSGLKFKKCCRNKKKNS